MKKIMIALVLALGLMFTGQLVNVAYAQSTARVVAFIGENTLWRDNGNTLAFTVQVLTNEVALGGVIGAGHPCLFGTFFPVDAKLSEAAIRQHIKEQLASGDRDMFYFCGISVSVSEILLF